MDGGDYVHVITKPSFLMDGGLPTKLWDDFHVRYIKMCIIMILNGNAMAHHTSSRIKCINAIFYLPIFKFSAYNYV